MDPSVKDIPSLIKWLANKHHGGAASAMSKPLGVSVSTPSFWKRGVVEPKTENLVRISQVYNLPLLEVVALAGKRRGRRLPTISGGSGDILGPHVVQVVDFMLLIRHWLWTRLARPVHHSWCPA